MAKRLNFSVQDRDDEVYDYLKDMPKRSAYLVNLVKKDLGLIVDNPSEKSSELKEDIKDAVREVLREEKGGLMNELLTLEFFKMMQGSGNISFNIEEKTDKPINLDEVDEKELDKLTEEEAMELVNRRTKERAEELKELAKKNSSDKDFI